MATVASKLNRLLSDLLHDFIDQRMALFKQEVKRYILRFRNIVFCMELVRIPTAVRIYETPFISTQHFSHILRPYGI
jgi:hypothetical protein